jgi:hypothetical protein
MKTYLLFTKNNEMIATEAYTRQLAYNKCASKGEKVKRTSIQLSSCHIDFVSCRIIK